MKTIFPALAKRALSFALALVLLLSLCPILPLTADAVSFAAGWTPSSKYDFLVGSFDTDDEDLIFHDDEPYDWTFSLQQEKKDVDLGISATIENANGNTISSYNGIRKSYKSPLSIVMLSSTDFPELTTDLAGDFTLTCNFTYDGKPAGTLTQTFSRVISKEVEFTPTSHSKSDMIFTYADPIDLQLNIKKTDGSNENLTAVTTITNTSNGVELPASNYPLPVSTNMNLSLKDLVKDVANITSAGKYVVDIVLKDGNADEYSHTFSFNVVPMDSPTAILNDDVYQQGKTGMIFTQDDNPLQLSLYYPDGVEQAFTVKYSGTCNGESIADRTFTIPASGGMTLKSTDFLKYGIYKDLTITVLDPDDKEIMTSGPYSFSLVLSTANPGEMSLLNINDHFTSEKGDAESKLTLAANTGANMWRASIPWASVEQSKGNFIMPHELITVMEKTKELQMQALVILAYGNDALYGEPNLSAGSDWLEKYSAYCYYVAKYMADHYPNEVVAFEIWNEWNHASMSKVPATYRTGTYYAQAVIAASAAIEQAITDSDNNPTFKIIAGATAGDGYDNSGVKEFIEAMLQELQTSNKITAIDGFSFHSYADDETKTTDTVREFERISPVAFGFTNRYASVKTLLQKYGFPDDIEIWMTETGWSTNEVPDSSTGRDNKTHTYYGATEAEQAAYMVQLYTLTMADGTVDQIFWYDLMNDISNQTKVWATNQTESNWGLIHNWNNSGNQPMAYSAKPGYVAMCAMSSMLGGAEFDQKISSSNGVYAYRFSKGDKYFVVAWTTNEDGKSFTATSSGEIIITDMYGNASGPYTGSSIHTLTVDPIYIEYSQSDTLKLTLN